MTAGARALAAAIDSAGREASVPFAARVNRPGEPITAVTDTFPAPMLLRLSRAALTSSAVAPTGIATPALPSVITTGPVRPVIVRSTVSARLAAAASLTATFWRFLTAKLRGAPEKTSYSGTEIVIVPSRVRLGVTSLPTTGSAIANVAVGLNVACEASDWIPPNPTCPGAVASPKATSTFPANDAWPPTIRRPLPVLPAVGTRGRLTPESAAVALASTFLTSIEKSLARGNGTRLPATMGESVPGVTGVPVRGPANVARLTPKPTSMESAAVASNCGASGGRAPRSRPRSASPAPRATLKSTVFDRVSWISNDSEWLTPSRIAATVVVLPNGTPASRALFRALAMPARVGNAVLGSAASIASSLRVASAASTTAISGSTLPVPLPIVKLLALSTTDVTVTASQPESVRSCVWTVAAVASNGSVTRLAPL